MDLTEGNIQTGFQTRRRVNRRVVSPGKIFEEFFVTGG